MVSLSCLSLLNVKSIEVIVYITFIKLIIRGMEDELTDTLFDQTLISLAHDEISLIFIIPSSFVIKGIKRSFG